MGLLTLITILTINLILISGQSNLWDTYELCRSTLGDPSWICDPYKKLKSKDTIENLDNLLWRFQSDVPCYCPNPSNCYRYSNVSIQSGVMSALIVTNRIPQNIVDVANRIYHHSNLPSSNACDNGMLIIYAMDDQKLYVVRGTILEQILFTNDADTILNETMAILRTRDYTEALPSLLQQYLSKLQGDTYERQNSWAWVVGIVVASVIGVLALAVLCGLCMARYCAKKKSLSRPPPPPLLKSEEKKTKGALRRVQRKRNKIMAKQKKETEKGRTISGRPVSPKRLASAKRRLFRKQNKKQRQIYQQQQQQQRALLTPSSGSEEQEQYYLISEPGSTIYAPPAQSTLRRDWTGADPGTWGGTGAGAGAGTGAGPGTWGGTGAGAGPGTWGGTGARAGPGTWGGTGARAGPGTWGGTGAGAGAGTGAGPGTWGGTGAGAGPGTWGGTGARAGAGPGGAGPGGAGAGPGGAGTESPYATATVRPPSSIGYQPPAILYPNNSQAVFNHPSSPSTREVQRKDTYVYEEEDKEHDQGSNR